MVKESFYNGSLALLDENRFFGKKKAEECKAINDKIERALFRVDLLEFQVF